MMMVGRAIICFICLGMFCFISCGQSFSPEFIVNVLRFSFVAIVLTLTIIIICFIKKPSNIKKNKTNKPLSKLEKR